jgi:hypothetical protein
MRSLFALLSMLFCIAAGCYLLGITPAQQDNMMAMIAHGIGIYCIGKGLYCGGDLFTRVEVFTPAWPPTMQGAATKEPSAPPRPSFLRRHPRIALGVLAGIVLACIAGGVASRVLDERAYQKRLRSAEEYDRTHPKGTY